MSGSESAANGSKATSEKTSAGFDGKSFARRLPGRPGVYLMRDAGGKALYVGKAADLRKRVSSYFDSRPKIERIMRMVAQITAIEISLTRNEGEALLLENEWIKSLRPRYNVLLRDDKSYPWIVMTTDHEFAGFVNKVLGLFAQIITTNRFDHMLDYIFSELVVFYVGIVLGGNDHGFNANRFAMFIFHCYF